MINTNNKGHQIIVFDGLCNLCNASVNFIIKRDNKDYFRFTPSQSETGKSLLKKAGITDIPATIILITNTGVYTKSSAALQITKHLNGLYPLLFILLIIPAFLRNSIYDFIAKNRYKWFGKKDVCMIPTEKLKSKFIL